MISSIFGKTKPINFIIVLSVLFFFYWVVHFVLYEMAYNPEQLVLQTGVLTLLILSFFVVDFIVKRNKLTGLNTFTILFFALFIIVFPESVADNNAVVCNFFILLATRRVISMRSLKDVKFKIFDASLWILISSLFYDWAILYFLVVVIAIYTYEPKNFKNWLVPFVALFTMSVIAYSVLILTGSVDFFNNHYQFKIHWDLQYHMNWANSSKLIIYVVFVFIMAMYSIIKLGNIGVGKIVTTRLLGFIFIIGLILNLLLSSENNSPMLLTFFPASVLFTNYIEAIKRPNLREVILLFSVFIPFIVFLSILILK